MRLMKKLFALFIAVLSVVSFAGCNEPEEVIVVEEQEKDDKVYIYSYDEEFKGELDSVLDEFSELGQMVEYIIPETDNYGEYMQQLLENKDAEKYPDVIVAKINDAKRFVSSAYTASIDEYGISEQDISQMYDFTKSAVTDESGKIKALSGTVYPGAFIYRKALAKEYLGSDDPKEVQSFVRDWLTFEDTARTIYKASEGKTAMLASGQAMDRVYANSKDASWIKDDEVSVVPAFDRLLDERYIFSKEKFALSNDISTEQYIRAASKNAVFGYFASVDFVVGGLAESFNGMRATLGYVGDWGICPGPAAYVDGGSWVFVTKASSDKDLLGQAIKKMYCDMSVLENARNEKKAFVNNQKVMANALNSGKGKITALGGSDYIEVFDSQAQRADMSFEDVADESIEAIFFDEIENYIKSDISKEELEKEFLEKAKEILNPSVTEETEETLQEQ